MAIPRAELSTLYFKTPVTGLQKLLDGNVVNSFVLRWQVRDEQAGSTTLPNDGYSAEATLTVNLQKTAADLTNSEAATRPPSPVSHGMLGTVRNVVEATENASLDPGRRNGFDYFTQAYAPAGGQPHEFRITHVMFVDMPGTEVPHQITYGPGRLFDPQTNNPGPAAGLGRPIVTKILSLGVDPVPADVLPQDYFNPGLDYASNKQNRENYFDFETTYNSLIGFHLSVDGGQSWSQMLFWASRQTQINQHYGQPSMTSLAHLTPKSFFTMDASGPGSGNDLTSPQVEHIHGWQASERIWFGGSRKLQISDARVKADGSRVVYAERHDVDGDLLRDDTVLYRTKDERGSSPEGRDAFAVIYDYTFQQDDLADGLTLEWI